MASVFGHAFTGFMLAKIAGKRTEGTKFAVLASMAAVVPDADIIALHNGVPYDALFGHRGFSHSITGALLIGFAIALVFFGSPKRFSRRWWLIALFFFIATMSHGIIDGMTTGGLGIAYFAPWSPERYWMPIRMIHVSGLNASNLMTKWGWAVLRSEIIWIGVPLLIVWIMAKMYRDKVESAVPRKA